MPIPYKARLISKLISRSFVLCSAHPPHLPFFSSLLSETEHTKPWELIFEKTRRRYTKTGDESKVAQGRLDDQAPRTTEINVRVGELVRIIRHCTMVKNYLLQAGLRRPIFYFGTSHTNTRRKMNEKQIHETGKNEKMQSKKGTLHQ